MDDKMRKKIKFTAIAVPALAAGTVAIAAAYQSGTKYQPSQSDQKIQENQVVFNDDENTVNQKSEKKKEESELWKENQDAQEEDSLGQDHADYMFESEWATKDDNTSLQSASVNTDGAAQNTAHSAENGTKDEQYDLVTDGSKADVTIKNNTTSTPSNGTNSSDKNNGTNGNGGNNGTDGNGGNNGNLTPIRPEPTPDPTPIRPEPTPDPTPIRPEPTLDPTPSDPADAVKDPESEKIDQSNSLLPQKPFSDGVKPKPGSDEDGTSTEDSIVIERPQYMGDDLLFYKGQTLSKKDIYNGLVTYVVAEDGTQYLWGADAYDRYVRIDAVSFDDGKTWITSFPVTIPNDSSSNFTMLIKASYRLSVNDKEWSEKIVPYLVEDSGIFLLSKPIEKNQTSIDKKTVLNAGSQNLETGQVLNLLYYQSKLFENEELTELFPGWKEKGELVPWFYSVTAGRHVLEPMESVPLSEDYTVKVVYQWMSDDFEVGLQYDNLCYLQTLTNFKEKAAVARNEGEEGRTRKYKELDVPEYVQAVVIDADADLEIAYLNLPDTVLYVDNTTSGLRVTKGYRVDDENPCYASNKDGVLTNKAGTELLEIPHDITEITVSDQVTKVNIDQDNQISKINLTIDSLDQLADIQYENLSECKILVDEKLLDEYIEGTYKKFQKGKGNCVASFQNPEVTYQVLNHAVISSEGKLHKVLSTSATSVSLPDSVETIEPEAFQSASNVTTMIMPKDGSEVTLEENCFADSNLRTIQCYNMKQVESLQEQISRSGASEDLRIELIQKSKEGFYYGLQQDESQATATIIDAPKDITEFDGTLTAEDGTELTVARIGDAAFADCENLVWVELPQSVKEIGYQAFEGCKALQGLMISSEDTISIADGILDGCSSLRFAASNAMTASVQDEYDFRTNASCDSQTLFFAPTGAEGYDGYFVSFTEASGITGYQMVDIGGNAKALYGCSEEKGTWMAIRTGSDLPEHVVLPESTVEIFNYSFANAISPTGEYDVNWEDIGLVAAIGEGAFSRSELGGHAVVGANCYYIGNYAFSGCENLESIVTENTELYLHEGVFNNCTALKTVEFKGFAKDGTLCTGSFNGCDHLTDLIFDDTEAPGLLIYGAGHFYFNSDWENNESEAAKAFRVHVPEGSELSYVKTWRYVFLKNCASIETDSTTAYQEAWNKENQYLTDWDNWIFPTDEETDEALAGELCDAENEIRRLIGTGQVSEATDYYPYRVSDDGFITLIGAPSYITDVSLTGDTLELLDGWCLDYIGTGAFSKSSQLRNVFIPETLAGIYQNAFEGTESGELNLYFEGSTPPELMREDDSTAFTFGVDESKIHLSVPEGTEETYIEAWKYALAGYADQDTMRAAVKAELEAAGNTPSDEEVDKEMELRLIKVENRLRTMLGMELLEDPEQDQNQEVPSQEEQQTEEQQGEETLSAVTNGKTESVTEVAEPEGKEDAGQETDPEKDASSEDRLSEAVPTDGTDGDVTQQEQSLPEEQTESENVQEKTAQREETKE